MIHVIAKYTPKSTMRGVQLGVGVILMSKGIKFIIPPDPNLAVQSVGPSTPESCWESSEGSCCSSTTERCRLPFW